MSHQMLVEDAKTVLLIDGAGSAERLSAPLALSTGARIITAPDLTSALRAIEEHKPQAVISGLPLTDELGFPLLFYVSVHHPGLPVIVLLDEATDDMVQQAQWYGATKSLPRCADAGSLSADVATALGMSNPFDIWDRVAEVAAGRHLSLVPPTPVIPFDADARLQGLFRGLGDVRGLRGTVILDDHGAVLSVMNATWSLDGPHTVARLHALTQASHKASTGTGLDEFETTALRTDQETVVMSCCAQASTHVHVVTLVAPDGNRSLAELAHKRLQRECHQAPAASDYPATLPSAGEISA
jgi:ActR/RegA family two-component response regulator